MPHAHEYLSACCGWRGALAPPNGFGELDEGKFGVTGRCGRCGNGAGFDCDGCRCPECDRIMRDENGRQIGVGRGTGMKCGQCAYA